MDNLRNFFIDHFPDIQIMTTFTLPFAFVAFGALYVCGHFKQKLDWRTGMTRKLYHLIIFTSSFFIQYIWDLKALCYFGLWTSLAVFFAVLRGNGNTMYEAMAREGDDPHRTYFIIVPWCATFLGGVLGNVFFGKFAIMGYLVVGLADSIAEPVGLIWGKHRYKAFSYGFNGRTTFRSFEGSVSIFTISVPIFIFGLMSLGVSMGASLIVLSLLIGIAIAVVEGVSPHGWDNFTLQMVASGITWWLFN